MNRAKYQIINSFVLKIIGVITMSIDHVGQLLVLYGKHKIWQETFWTSPMCVSGYILCCIGRIAFPIFAILVAEAMIHTKSREKYMAKLGIMAIIILIGNVLANLIFEVAYNSNIFLELLCASSIIYLIERKDKFTPLIVVPLFFVAMGYVITYYANNNVTINWWPIFLKPQYDIYGLLLILGFYYSYKIADIRLKTIKEENNLDKSIDELKQFAYYRTLVNWFWIGVIIVINVLFWLIIRNNTSLDAYYMPLQSWSIVSIIPIFLYNGVKGYKSKITQYAFYVYYPLHLVIIFVIFRIIFGY